MHALYHVGMPPFRCNVAKCIAKTMTRVISGSESHSATPFRIKPRATATKLPPPTHANLEPAGNADYRLKHKKPDPVKMCF